MENDERERWYEERARTKAKLDAYLDADTQEAIDRAEAALRDGAGPRPRAGAVDRAGWGEAAWLGQLQLLRGGIRCPSIFGMGEERRARYALLELAEPAPHPKGHGTTRIVPVVPPGDREPFHWEGVFSQSAGDQLYERLLVWQRRASLELPPHMRAYLAAERDTLIQQICTGWRTRTWSAWSGPQEPLGPAPIAPPPVKVKRKNAATDLRLFDDGTALLAFSHALVRVRCKDGKVLSLVETAGSQFLAAPTPDLAWMLADVPTGEQLPFRALAEEATRNALAALGQDASEVDHGELPEDVDEYATRAFALDLRKGGFRKAPLGIAPPIRFREAQERSFLDDDEGRTIELLAVGDYPVINVFSPDHRFIWVQDKHGSGGIFHAEDGGLVRSVEVREPTSTRSIPCLDDKGPGKNNVRRIRAEWQPPIGRAAFTRGVRGGWVTYDAGLLCENGRPFAAVTGRASHAAFSPDGSLLGLATKDELRVIDVSGPVPRVATRCKLKAAHARSAR